MMRVSLGLIGNDRKGEKVEKYSPGQVERAAMAALLSAIKSDDIDAAMEAYRLLKSCDDD